MIMPGPGPDALGRGVVIANGVTSGGEVPSRGPMSPPMTSTRRCWPTRSRPCGRCTRPGPLASSSAPRRRSRRHRGDPQLRTVLRPGPRPGVGHAARQWRVPVLDLDHVPTAPGPPPDPRTATGRPSDGSSKGPTVTGAGGTSCKPRPHRGPWSFWMRSVGTELGSGDQGQLPPASSRRSPESLARYAPQGYRRPCRLVWAVLGGTARLSHSNTRPPSSQTSAYHLYEFLYSSEEPRRGRCGVGARCSRFSSPR